MEGHARGEGDAPEGDDVAREVGADAHRGSSPVCQYTPHERAPLVRSTAETLDVTRVEPTWKMNNGLHGVIEHQRAL